MKSRQKNSLILASTLMEKYNFESYYSNLNHYLLTSGSSEGSTSLSAFDLAIRSANLGNLKMIPVEEPPAHLSAGHTHLPFHTDTSVPVMFSSITSKYPGEKISSAIAIAVPEDPESPSLIIKKSDSIDAEVIEEQVRTLAKATIENRNLKLRELSSISVQHNVEYIGSTFAAILFSE